MYIFHNGYSVILKALRNNKKNGTKIIIPIILKIKSLSWLPVLYINNFILTKQKTIDSANKIYLDIQSIF